MVLRKGILDLFIYKNIKKKNIFSFLIITGELFFGNVLQKGILDLFIKGISKRRIYFPF
jgi:hypothetical protein